MSLSPVPLTDMFRVDMGRYSVQAYQDVAPTQSGGSFVVWEVYDGSYLNGSNWGDRDVTSIFGRFMDEAGNPLGDDFRVNIDRQYSQTRPAVTMLEDGGHLVVFGSIAHSSGNFPHESLMARRFDADGNAMGGEFILMQASGASARNAEIATLPDGTLVLIWQQGSAYGPYALRGALLSPTGTPLGSSFAIAEVSADYYSQMYQTPQVQPLGDGGFVVVWTEQNDASYDVYVRQFNAFGVAVTEPQIANTTTPDRQWFPDVIASADGGYLVAWGSGNQEPSGYNLYAQRFDGAGVKIGPEMRLNADTSRDSFHVSLAAVPDGGFVAVWTRGWLDYDYHFNIVLQRFDADGQPIGGETLIHPAVGAFRGSPEALTLPDGSVLITWRDGNQIVSRKFDPHLIGASGDDMLTGDDGNNLIVGQGAHDLLSGEAGNDTLLGGDGNDTLYGGLGRDSLEGGDGANYMRGGGSADTVLGGAGHDMLWGDEGTDYLDGGEGDDLLFGGTSADTLIGGVGNDTLQGETGDDLLDGGVGDDLIFAGSGADTLDGGAGNDTLDGGSGRDLIRGGPGNDALIGGSDNDRLEAGSGFDTLLGGSGNDRLDGGSGDDLLDGGSGNDTLIGGSGNDTLTGGTGRDVFVFAGNFGNNVITDFTDGLDRFDFRAHPATDFAALDVTGTGADALIADGQGNTILVLGAAGLIDAGDFLF